MSKYLKEIKCLIKWKRYEHLEDKLKRPVQIQGLSGRIDPDDLQLISDIRKGLKPLPEIAFLFEIFLCSSALMSIDDRTTASSMLSSLGVDMSILFSGLFTDNTSDNLNQFRFATVPVLMTIPQNSADVVNFMIGKGDVPTLQPYPEWVESVMDESAREGVKNACLAVDKRCAVSSGKGKFCFPLVAPLKNTPAITGGSLGLPLAIGFETLIHNEKMPGGIIATGRITKNGRVESVLLEEKINFAEKLFSILICPRSAECMNTGHGIELFPVDSLDEAMLVVNPWTPGNSSRLHNLLSIIKGDADNFIKYFGTIDAGYLKYGMDRGLFSEFIDSIYSDKNRMGKFTSKFYEAIITSEKSLEDKELVSELVKDDDFPRIREISVKAALLVASAKNQILNHRGKTIEAGKWKKTGLEIADEAFKRDVNAYTDFINHILISDKDRFNFNPDLPKHAKMVIKNIDTYHQPGIINETTAKFCGTLSQHYAFCGPSHFDQFMKFHKLSCQYFGEDIASDEYEKEWRRQYNYLAYAAMDKQDFALAERAIKTYIGFDEDKHLMDIFESDFPGYEIGHDFQKYFHACLCRFIAETQNARLAEKYMDYAPVHAEKNTGHHPYQLWFFNLGRISLQLGDKKNAEKNFRKSLEICMTEKSGETIRIMGLLPLSYLYAHKWWCNNFSEMFTRIRHTALAVNKDFFSILEQEPMEDVLLRIYKTPEKFFPFTFR